MTAIYRLSAGRRILNALVRVLLCSGLGPAHTYLLTVRGWKSGQLRSTPVTLVEEAGLRWLVAPYGEVGWVRNARAAGEGVLSRGRRSEAIVLFELEPAEAAPILKRYLAQAPITRPFFDVAPTSGLAEFTAEAPRHPVFRVVPSAM